MATDFTYEWERFPFFGDISTVESGDINQPFAAYLSDWVYGIKLRIEPDPDPDIVHVWNHRLESGGLRIAYIDVKYFREDGELATVEIQNYDSNGNPLGFEVFLEDVTSGFINISLNGFLSPTSEQEFQAAVGTATAYYEKWEDSNLIEFGNLGGGFDVRALDIQNLQIINPIVKPNDPDPAKNSMNITGDIYALPVSTTLFPGGWAPVSDIDLSGFVGVFATLMQNEPIPVTAPSGKVASFDFDALGYRWNGKTDGPDSGQPVYGLHAAVVSAFAENPGPIPETVSIAGEAGLFYSYKTRCSNDSGSTCAAPEGMRLTYNSHNSDRDPQSFGYGWSSLASVRIVETFNEVMFQMANGESIRWIKQGANFIPFQENDYVEIEKINAQTQWKVTFKDQMTYILNVGNGRLISTQDRNSNQTLYNRDVSGHLTSVVDQNGRSLSFVNRSDGQPQSMTINGGLRQTNFIYYAANDPVSPNRLRFIIDPEGNTTRFTYDANGRLFTETDPQGYTIAYWYDQYGRIIQKVFDTDISREYFYSDTDEEGNVEIRIEDLDTFAVGLHRIRSEDRDVFGRLIAVDELLEDTGSFFDRVYRDTSFEYNDPDEGIDPNPYLLTSVEDHNGNIIERTYTDNGNVKTITDKGGFTTTFEYADEIDVPLNPLHRNLVRKIYRPSVTVDGTLVTYSPTEIQYDANGNAEKVIDAQGNETTFLVDVDGLVLSLTDRNGHVTEFVYDGLPQNGDRRNLLEIKTPKGLTPADGFRTVTFTYDNFDNILTATDDLGHQVVTTYDDLDRPLTVTDALSNLTTLTYQDLLLVESLLPSNNGSAGLSRKTTLSYDADSSRVEEVQRDIDAVGTQELRVKYGYNGYSELTSLTRLKDRVEKAFSFDYDLDGRQISQTDPLTNSSSMAYEPFCLGNTVTSARGVRRKSTLDARCLLREIQVGDIDPADDLEVLNARETRNWDYDELGRMISSSQTSSSEYLASVLGIDNYHDTPRERFYSYDELDRLVKLVFEDGTEMLWEYDPEGNVTKMTDPEGKVCRYEYYDDNLLHKVIIERPSQADRVFTYSYDDAARLDEIEYPAGTGITAIFRNAADTPGSGFDGNGNLRFLRYEKSGMTEPLRSLEWTYDASDNRQSMLDVSPGKAVKWEFEVDWLDRLVAAKRAEAVDVASLPASPLGASHLQREYVFDESDNRLYFDDHVAGVTYHYTYKSFDDNGTPRFSDQIEEIFISSTVGDRTLANFSSLETFEHDVDGNMTKRILASTGLETILEWSDFDRLRRVETDDNGTKNRLQDARYDVNGLRDRRLDKNGNTSVEHGPGIMTTTSKPGSSSSAAPSISYIQGHLIMGAEIDDGSGPEFVYHLGDVLGTVRDVVDDTGAIIKSFEFTEYGDLMSSTGIGIASPKTWIGGLSVNDDTGDSGMFNMGHRSYLPTLGRFLSRDPIGFAGGYNLYNYAGNNPTTFADPTGLKYDDWTNIRADHPRAGRLFDTIRGRLPGYGTDPALTKAWDSMFKNIRFGDSKKKGKRGETFDDIIILENDPCDTDAQASELFHELLHRANNMKLFNIVPRSLYTTGKMRLGSGEQDAQNFARNHAWVYLQHARFGNTGDSNLERMFYWDQLHNPGGQFDTNPGYLDSIINRFGDRFNFYGL